MVPFLVIPMCAAAALHGRPLSGRRQVALAGAAAIAPTIFPQAGVCYDSIQASSMDLDAMEKARKKREEEIQRNRKAIQPYIKKLIGTTTPVEFSDACDELTVWIIGQGKLPEGIDAKQVRDALQDTYEALPQKAYACEMTRTNKGVCFSPGEPADSAYESAITQLRKYATRKGKGSLSNDRSRNRTRLHLPTFRRMPRLKVKLYCFQSRAQ